MFNGRGTKKEENSTEYCEKFFTNWFDDFHFYMERVPGLKDEMLKHLK